MESPDAPLLSALGGLHVVGARLGLDGSARHGVGFLQAYDGLPHRSARLLCTRTVATLLGSRGAQPLTPPPGRPFQMGRLALELLPAGSSPGAALLRLHHRGRSLLFSAAGRLDPLPTAEPLEWRDADVLVVDASRAEVDLADVAQLVTFVEEAIGEVQAGKRVALRMHEPTVALDVLKLAGGRVPVVLASGLTRLVKRYAVAGIELPVTVRKPRRPDSPRLVLELARTPPTDVDLRWQITPETPTQPSEHSKSVRTLGFARHATGRQLDALVRASGIAEVLAFGAQAEALAARLRAEGRTCEILRADAQLTLV